VIIVSNASPLITLAKVGSLGILAELFGEIFIAREVHHEITVMGAGRAGAKEVHEAAWIRLKSCSDIDRFIELKRRFRLGSGETATVLLAHELSADLAIIDERAARAFAKDLDVKVIGTVGILESAFRKQLLRDLRGIYAQLLRDGTYIDTAILNRSLESFGLRLL
jgi:uncharacterized protein